MIDPNPLDGTGRKPDEEQAANPNVDVIPVRFILRGRPYCLEATYDEENLASVALVNPESQERYVISHGEPTPRTDSFYLVEAAHLKGLRTLLIRNRSVLETGRPLCVAGACYPQLMLSRIREEYRDAAPEPQATYLDVPGGDTPTDAATDKPEDKPTELF